MTTYEFSTRFDVLYNNIASNQGPGLNEYEKSLFLTKAQEEIVKNYFRPSGNVKQEGFDDSPKRDADFRSIIRNKKLDNIQVGDSYDPRFDQRSIAYKYPKDIFISLNEQLMDGITPYTVVPISFDEYDRLMKKPYKYPPKYMAWRLITEENTVSIEKGAVVEIIGRFESTPDYRIRYIKKLNPIILCDLHTAFDSSIDINGEYEPMTSELPEELHEEILQRAIEIAKATWTTTGQDNSSLAIELGKRSE